MKKNVIVNVKNEYTSWSEDYRIDDTIDPEAYGKEIVVFFNRTLKDGETAREFVSARTVNEQEIEEVENMLDETVFNKVIHSVGKSIGFTEEKKVYSGWLSPKAVFYPVGYMQHREWAERHCKKNDIDTINPDRLYGGNPADALLNLGWIQFAYGMLSNSAMHTKKHTSAQNKWLDENLPLMDDDQVKDYYKWLNI